MKRLLSRTTPVAILALSLVLTSCSRSEASKRKVLQNKGSDTLVNVAQAWAEHYGKKSTDLAIAVSGGGSGTGISAMINGTVDIANASRKMKQKEIDAARKNDIDPVEHVVGYDALAVYVHKDNPIESISIAQLAAIYGEGGATETWSQLGITIPGAKSDEIVRVSRQNNSGTYAYFRKAVLGGKREYKLGSLDMHGSKDLVDLVEKTRGAIGYSGLAYATDHVKLVPVKKDKDAPTVTPSVKSAADRSYPIARPLFMYTAGEPKGAVKEYLDFVLSDEGQKIILDKGYAPVRSLVKAKK